LTYSKQAFILPGNLKLKIRMRKSNHYINSETTFLIPNIGGADNIIALVKNSSNNILLLGILIINLIISLIIIG
jgi:hypothetical protein